MKKQRKVFKLGFIQLAFNGDLWGICLFDKYCYINKVGFEILK